MTSSIRVETRAPDTSQPGLDPEPPGPPPDPRPTPAPGSDAGAGTEPVVSPIEYAAYGVWEHNGAFLSGVVGEGDATGIDVP
jgi:hypothetical protein